MIASQEFLLALLLKGLGLTLAMMLFAVVIIWVVAKLTGRTMKEIFDDYERH